jgi:uncharacterized protein YciI
MHFMLFYDYVDNVAERRAPFREEHLRLARAAHERGELLLAGAFADPVDGAALAFRADSQKTVEEFATHDPYVRNGVVRGWRIRPWTVVIGG